MSTATADYLTAPCFERLWRAARDAWERNGGLTGSAVVHDLTEAEAIEIAGLLGKRRPLRAHASARLQLVDLDRALRDFAMPLEEWLEQLDGTLVDRRQQRADAEEARAELWRAIEDRAVRIHRDLEIVVADLRRTGLARRLAGNSERRLLEQAFAVLEVLVGLERTVDIAVLAAQQCGDAKALNAGNPVGTIVLRALALLDGDSTPADEEARRELWERHLVICNSLSSTVLTLNVRLEGDTPLARSLALSAEAHEPRVLTLRELSRADGKLANSRLFICENPTVVSAAAELEMQSGAGLLCVEGWPSVAAHRVLRLAQRSQTELLYHGDFDWHGLRIADSVISQYGAEPWRMSAADYLEAISGGMTSRVLGGEPHTATWDGDLSPAMQAAGKVIEEEGAVLARLLEDLSG